MMRAAPPSMKWVAGLEVSNRSMVALAAPAAGHPVGRLISAQPTKRPPHHGRPRRLNHRDNPLRIRRNSVRNRGSRSQRAMAAESCCNSGESG